MTQKSNRRRTLADLAREGEMSRPPQSISPKAHRVTQVRRSSIPPPAEPEVVEAVADLLVAAAMADGGVDRKERQALYRLLKEFLDVVALPSWLEKRLMEFDEREFLLEEAAARLEKLTEEQKRHVLEMVRVLCDSNDAYDLEEERFMLSLTMALGLSEDVVEDLVLRVSPSLDGKLKRAFDIAFSGTFLALGWPLLLGIGAAVRLTSEGPALFAQDRFGREGRRISVLKFRSMRVTENGAEVKQATQHDSRITPLGAFLRRTSLDELPQFINVFRGEMSVVGPRPHATAHNEYYRTQILEYMLRHKIKPGITGLAQVRGWRGETDTLDKMIQRVTHDLEYIQTQSFRLDMKIIWGTIFGKSVRQNAR